MLSLRTEEVVSPATVCTDRVGPAGLEEKREVEPKVGNGNDWRAMDVSRWHQSFVLMPAHVQLRRTCWRSVTPSSTRRKAMDILQQGGVNFTAIMSCLSQ